MALEDHTPEELFNLARNGDEDALGLLLNQHREWLRNCLKEQLPATAEFELGDSDMLQRTILSALRAFPNFHGEGIYEFRAWLKKIQEHNVFDLKRKQANRQSRAKILSAEVMGKEYGEANDDREPDPTRRAEVQDELNRLLAALDELPADQKTAVQLRHFDGLPLKDIQQKLGRSHDACAGLIKRGMESLRQKMKDN